MTHNELRGFDKYGRRNRINIVKITDKNEFHPEKWAVFSEKPGEMRRQVFESEQEARQAYEDIKKERGL